MQETQDSLFNSTNIKIVQNPDIGNNMAKITLMGIGGGGCNMIDNFCQKNKYKIKIIAANTDNQVLKESIAPFKIQLGPKTTNGLGAGMDPTIGAEAAIESADNVREYLDGSDMVFLCAGLGGGTGSGALPIIVQIAKELGILCIVVVTMPFSYEMGRDTIASQAIEDIKTKTDSYMMIYNDKILDIVSEHTGAKESFKIIDNVLFDAVHGLSEIILNYKRLNINVDFADISTTLTKKGLTLIGIGHKKGDDSAMKALDEAINSPLLNIESITLARSIIIHFVFNPNFPIHRMNEIMHYIKNSADLGAKCITGTVWSEEMEEDEVKITVIATGFEPKVKKVIQDIELEEIVKEKTTDATWFDKMINKWF